VSTPLVLLISNDDVLLRRGTIAACQLLLTDHKAACAGGPIAGFSMRNETSRRASIPTVVSSARNLHGKSCYQAIQSFRRVHRDIWNMVHRTDVMEGAWSFAASNDITELHMLEFAVSEYCLTQGYVLSTPKSHYLRLESQTHRGLHELPDDEIYRVGSSDWFSKQHRIDAALSLILEEGQTLEGQDYRLDLLRGRVIYGLYDRIGLHIRRWIGRARVLPWPLTRRLAEHLPLIPLSAFPTPRDSPSTLI
jgi:hypothetical protein